MQIKYLGNSNCEIKTKNAVVEIDPPKINDYALKIAGEFEIANIMAEGIKISETQTLFVYNVENVLISYLDGLTRKLENDELEFLSVVDVLIVPFGQEKALKIDQIQELVNAIDPRMIILIDYQNLNELSKAFGTIETQQILKFSKSNLPEEGRQIVALE